MKKITIFLFSVCLALQLVAQEQHYFMNPVIRGDMPDPSIIRIDDTYYATGTSSEWAPFYPVFTSKDMVNWKQAGHIFSKQPGLQIRFGRQNCFITIAKSIVTTPHVKRVPEFPISE